VRLAVIVQGAMSPRAFARDEAAVIFGPRADEDSSIALGMVVGSMGHPFDWLWVDLFWLDILSGPTSPRG